VTFRGKIFPVSVMNLEKFHITKVDGLPIDIDSAAGRSAIHATGTTGFFNYH